MIFRISLTSNVIHWGGQKANENHSKLDLYTVPFPKQSVSLADRAIFDLDWRRFSPFLFYTFGARKFDEY